MPTSSSTATTAGRSKTSTRRGSHTKPPAATKRASGAEKTTKSARTTKSKDALAILRADHTLVTGLFAEYEKLRSTPKKKALVAQICTELSLHAQVEEEIFYPAVKAALHDKELVPEATVEHAALKDLISQVEGREPEGEMFDAKIKVLSEYVKHHVKEEQGEMFPKIKDSKLDLQDLGARILRRKEELQPQVAAHAEQSGIVAGIKDALGIEK